MAKKYLLLLTVFVFSLCACGQSSSGQSSGQASSTEQLAWQEQYDLGVRYLSEGNYEEAILAFTAAIEIDPKQALAYVGRGDAYRLSGETEENLAAAQADYEKSIELDETIAEAYLGLADVYIRQGEYDKALEILKQELEKTENNQDILKRVEEMGAGTFKDSSGKTRKSCYYNDGELVQYWLYEYDEAGNNVKTDSYLADGTWDYTEQSAFNEQGQEISSTTSYRGGSEDNKTYTYDGQGRQIREDRVQYLAGDKRYVSYYTLISYDEQAQTETRDEYREGVQLSHFVIECDADGSYQRGDYYLFDNSNQMYLKFRYEYIWNDDGSYGGYNRVDVA